MASTRSLEIARRFGGRAADYDRHAGLQRAVAARLATLLPGLDGPRILELGCGTGLLTRHLLALYPRGSLLATDLSSEMVEACRAGSATSARARFAVMDAEAPDSAGRFDLIAHSMTLQWLSDPAGALAAQRGLLAPGGELHYATIARGCFPEWRDVLEREGLDSGLLDMPPLPGEAEVEERRIGYGDALSFLRSMRAIGADRSRPGYRPLDAGRLRRALARLDGEHGARVTWRIAYGRLGPA